MKGRVQQKLKKKCWAVASARIAAEVWAIVPSRLTEEGRAHCRPTYS